MSPHPIFFSLCPSKPFLPQNEHWESKCISPHEVSIAESFGLKGMGLWGAVAGRAFLPVSYSTTFSTWEAGFTGQQTAALVKVKCMPQLGKVAEHIGSSAYVLGGQEASGDQGECSSHPCTHPVSLQVRNLAAEHPDGGRWQLNVTTGCTGTAANVSMCSEWRLRRRTKSSR